MVIYIVVDNPSKWELSIPGVEVLAAKDYLTNPDYSMVRNAKVFNLCRSYRYQSLGYYVSLLADARGHKPLPSTMTIQDMRYQTITRGVSEELDDQIQKSLQPLRSEEFSLSIYFGKNMAKRYDRLSIALFNLFPAPLLRAKFVLEDKWMLRQIKPISANEISDEHRDFVVQSAVSYFARQRVYVPKRQKPRYHMAILYNKEELHPPSNEKAIQKFIRAANNAGLSTEIIDKNEYGRISEFDALFIRETTNVNHHTYRFARKAEGEGLVVVDDPQSILKCSNKVFLNELMEHYRIPRPITIIADKDNMDKIHQTIGFPCILKLPDSYFSKGVVKVDNYAQFEAEMQCMLENPI